MTDEQIKTIKTLIEDFEDNDCQAEAQTLRVMLAEYDLMQKRIEDLQDAVGDAIIKIIELNTRIKIMKEAE